MTVASYRRSGQLIERQRITSAGPVDLRPPVGARRLLVESTAGAAVWFEKVLAKLNQIPANTYRDHTGWEGNLQGGTSSTVEGLEGSVGAVRIANIAKANDEQTGLLFARVYADTIDPSWTVDEFPFAAAICYMKRYPTPDNTGDGSAMTHFINGFPPMTDEYIVQDGRGIFTKQPSPSNDPDWIGYTTSGYEDAGDGWLKLWSVVHNRDSDPQYRLELFPQAVRYRDRYGWGEGPWRGAVTCDFDYPYLNTQFRTRNEAEVFCRAARYNNGMILAPGEDGAEGATPPVDGATNLLRVEPGIPIEMALDPVSWTRDSWRFYTAASDELLVNFLS